MPRIPACSQLALMMSLRRPTARVIHALFVLKHQIIRPAHPRQPTVVETMTTTGVVGNESTLTKRDTFGDDAGDGSWQLWQSEQSVPTEHLSGSSHRPSWMYSQLSLRSPASQHSALLHALLAHTVMAA